MSGRFPLRTCSIDRPGDAWPLDVMKTNAALSFLLRASLLISAMGWGISILAIFLPDDRAFDYLSGMAGENITGTPILGYWLKMTGLAFTFIGCLFFYSALFPRKTPGLTNSLLCFNLLCGIALIVIGRSYGFDDHVYIWDGLFGITTGSVGLGSTFILKSTT